MALQAQIFSTTDYNGGYDHFCMNVQPKQQIRQEQERIQHPLVDDYDSMSAFMVRQRQELDDHIRSQNERLKLLLQDQRNQEIHMFLKKLEAKASVLFRQREEEISKASNRRIELENLLRNLQEENHTWQRLARENAAMVVSLSNTLEQMGDRVQTTSCRQNDGVEDAASFCEGENGEMLCKNCGGRDSCVLLLPCRHLCLCTDCAPFLAWCPVCRMPKKGSIEALI